MELVRQQAGHANNNYVHGLSRHPLYGRWYRMMRRCYTPSEHQYADYGGRGIEVCREWHDPATYITYVEQELGPRPGPGYSIDRIDNDLGYQPGNLRWATRSQQNGNQRQRVLAGYPLGEAGARGIRLTRVGRYQARVCRDGRERVIGTFATLEEAVAARKAALA